MAGWRAHVSAAGDGWLCPSAEEGGSARWPSGRPKKRGAQATWPGRRRRRRGSAHLGLREQGGGGWLGQWPRTKEMREKIKHFLFLL
jgi:hypothetical protein